jgi:SulP family sulfate permease
MQASLAARWRPREAVAPALNYLRQPARFVSTYDRDNLRPDLLAGLTLAVILIPQSIAFAILAGLPPQMGLYASIAGAAAGALWGSSRQMYTGPSNALSLLVLSTLSAVALPGSNQYAVAAGLMALMVGIAQLLMGLVRLGVLINFVSHSVIVGFATGAGVLIIIKQIGPLLGIKPPGADVLATVSGVLRQLQDIHWQTAAIGLGTIATILILRRINNRLPATAIAIALASLVVYALDLADSGVAVVGELPRGLPPIARLPIFDLELIAELSTGALAVAAIGLVQAAAVSRSLALQTGQRLENNQEFVGQGFANLFSSIFSGYPVTGAFSSTAVNYRAGARTQLSSIVSSAVILLAVLVAGSLTAYLPTAALAGALIITAFGMIDRAEIARIWQGAPGDAIIMVVTFLGTLFLRLEFAVLAGILLSFALYILRTSTPRIHPVEPDESFRHFVYQPGREPCPQLSVIEVLGDLYFGAANYVEEVLLDAVDKRPEQRFLLMRMNHINQIDFSGIHSLENIVRTYRERGGDVFLTRVNYPVRRLMDSTGFSVRLGEDHLLPEDGVISELFHHVLDPAICIYECPVRVFRECQNLPKRDDLIGFHGPGWPSVDGTAPLPLIEASDLWQALHGPVEERPTVIDVREAREFKLAHIPGSQSYPLSTILQGEVDLAMDARLVLVCRSGRRSRRAGYVLKKRGYEHISVLNGGTSAWEAAGLLEAVTFEPLAIAPGTERVA